jgi:hypothetical protein
MAGVDRKLRAFVLAHRKCAGPRRTDASLPTPSGYRVLVVWLRAGLHALGDARRCGRGSATVGTASVRELGCDWHRARWDPWYPARHARAGVSAAPPQAD